LIAALAPYRPLARALPVQLGKPQPGQHLLGNAKERLHQLLPNAGLDPPHHAEIIEDESPFGLTAILLDEDRRGKAIIKQLMQASAPRALRSIPAASKAS